jgi:hypothetical protein
MTPESYGFRLALRSLRCRFLGQADMRRWKDLRNFDSDWDRRTEAIASLIPRGSRVIEFGAGRQKLHSYLDPSCTYKPADLVQREPNTIVLDLNKRPLPDLRKWNVDVAVFGGVLEYITGMSDLPEWLADQVSLCVASYELAGSGLNAKQTVLDLLSRSKAGWVNHYSEREFKDLFETAGLQLQTKTHWGSLENGGSIFVFRRH